MTTQNPPEQLIGGPGVEPGTTQSATTQPTTATTPQTTVAQPQTTTAHPIYMGGRKFMNTDELATYTQEVLAQKMALEARFTQPSTPIVGDPDKELADLFFEDPTTAVKVIQEKSAEKIRKEIAESDRAKASWNKFWSKNPDLTGYEDIVEVSRQKLGDRLITVPEDEAIETLAKTVRSRLSEIKQKPSGGTELPSGPAVVTGASGTAPEGVPIEHKPTSMVEQMQALAARRKQK